jgi:hypothetical protein
MRDQCVWDWRGRGLIEDRCLELALLYRSDRSDECPQLSDERTQRGHHISVAIDPSPTLSDRSRDVSSIVL